MAIWSWQGLILAPLGTPSRICVKIKCSRKFSVIQYMEKDIRHILARFTALWHWKCILSPRPANFPIHMQSIIPGAYSLILISPGGSVPSVIQNEVSSRAVSLFIKFHNSTIFVWSHKQLIMKGRGVIFIRALSWTIHACIGYMSLKDFLRWWHQQTQVDEFPFFATSSSGHDPYAYSCLWKIGPPVFLK